jgi:hypothetical protein
MSYTYSHEGSNSGYPLMEDRPDIETHTCIFCSAVYPDPLFQFTKWGFVCNDCFSWIDFSKSECCEEPINDNQECTGCGKPAYPYVMSVEEYSQTHK